MGIHVERKKMKILSEMLRKSWHFFSGITLIVGYSMLMLYTSKETALVSLTGVILVFMVFEHIRLEHQPKLFEIFNRMFRKKEIFRPSSMLPYLLSSLAVFAVFQYWIAFTAIMMLIIGDSASAFFGLMFGKKKIRRSKTYVGSGAELLANLLTGFVIMHEHPQIYIPMAITATIVETLTDKLEDNMTVPVSTAFCGYIMAMIFSIAI